MERLLGDLLPCIAGCLAPADAVAFGRTCRSVRSALALTATPPRRVLTRVVRHDPDDALRYGHRIPVPSSRVAVHSLRVSMSWKDQGWGNCKGSMCLVAEEETQRVYRAGEKQESVGGGSRRVVYSSGIAPHGMTPLSFTFQPRPTESYHLWYKVGGGGGHALHLSNMRIQALVFDDPSHCFGKALAFLDRLHIFHPWNEPVKCTDVQHDAINTILASTSHALANGMEVPPPVVAFLDRYGLSEADLSLKLIEAIETTWHDWEQELSFFVMSEAKQRTTTPGGRTLQQQEGRFLTSAWRRRSRA